MESNIIEAKLAELDKLQDDHLKLGKYMLEAHGSSMYPMDFLAVAVLNRSMSLISGFINLIRAMNYIAAAPLLRMQLDSALRFYAAFIVNKPHDFAGDVLKGSSIRKIKDKDGNSMTDRYLVEKLSERYPWINSVYIEASGFVHLSEKHIFGTITPKDETGSIGLRLGASHEHIPEKYYVEAIESFLASTKIILEHVYGWAYTKDNPEEIAALKKTMHEE